MFAFTRHYPKTVHWTFDSGHLWGSGSFRFMYLHPYLDRTSIYAMQQGKEKEYNTFPLCVTYRTVIHSIFYNTTSFSTKK